MHNHTKAGMLHGGHAMDHGKPAMETHDHDKESMLTPMVSDELFAFLVTLPHTFSALSMAFNNLERQGVN